MEDWMSAKTSDAAELMETIQKAWTVGDWETLGNCFHESMVIEDLKGGQRVNGREDCVDTYRQFMQNAELQHFQMGDVKVSETADTAVAHCTFAIDYEMHGERFQELGRDLFVLQREGERWYAVWRTLLPEDEQKVD
jgi:hypothetical protein